MRIKLNPIEELSHAQLSRESMELAQQVDALEAQLGDLRSRAENSFTSFLEAIGATRGLTIPLDPKKVRAFRVEGGTFLEWEEPELQLERESRDERDLRKRREEAEHRGGGIPPEDLPAVDPRGNDRSA